jgi:hypothetical protein
MPITRERLAGALTPDQYIETMASNRALFEENLAATRITREEHAFFAAMPAPLGVLVLTEDWCGDSAANLPIVVRLARDTGGLTVRILRREGNEDIAGRYLLDDGRNHIPTYIVHDEALNELGHIIERPAAVTEKINAFRAGWHARHPGLGDAATAIAELEPEVRERFLADLKDYRKELRDVEQRALIAGLRAIAERALAPA